jgi:hypothetical protein
MDAGAVKEAPFAGAVMVTVGGAVAVTVMLTAADVAVLPRESVTLAVRE